MCRNLGLVLLLASVVLVAGVATAADCDVNQDGIVDAADAEAVKAAAMTQEGDSDYDPRADLDGDGHVTSSDFAIILRCI